MKHKFQKVAAAWLFPLQLSQAVKVLVFSIKGQETRNSMLDTFLLLFKKKSRMDPVTVLLPRKLFYHKQRTDTGWSRRLRQAKY